MSTLTLSTSELLAALAEKVMFREEEVENAIRAVQDRVERLEDAAGLSVDDMDDWYEAREGGDC